jgi:hypothetical protein
MWRSDRRILAVEVVADCYSRDFEAAKFGSGHHGFEFVPLPELFLSSQGKVKVPSGNVIGTYRKNLLARMKALPHRRRSNVFHRGKLVHKTSAPDLLGRLSALLPLKVSSST